MLQIKYFASIREAVGLSGESFSFVDGETVQALVFRLSETHQAAQQILLDESVIAAVNQHLVEMSRSLCDGDEVALFPPVTGG